MAWRPAKSIVAFQRALDKKWPRRTQPDWILGDASHSARESQHNPDEHDVVTAIDVREGHINLKRLFRRLRKHRDVRNGYVIHDGKWFRGYARDGVKAYTVMRYQGSNPHKTHLHLSVSMDPKVYDDAQPWDLGFFRKRKPKHRPKPKPASKVPDWFHRELRVRDGNLMHGADVYKVQAKLGITGEARDGLYGPVTANAVTRWQKRHHLKADGIVGPKTAREMGK